MSYEIFEEQLPAFGFTAKRQVTIRYATKDDCPARVYFDAPVYVREMLKGNIGRLSIDNAEIGLGFAEVVNHSTNPHDSAYLRPQRHGDSSAYVPERTRLMRQNSWLFESQPLSLCSLLDQLQNHRH